MAAKVYTTFVNEEVAEVHIFHENYESKKPYETPQEVAAAVEEVWKLADETLTDVEHFIMIRSNGKRKPTQEELTELRETRQAEREEEVEDLNYWIKQFNSRFGENVPLVT